MKPQTIKINIENPCHENWDNMLQEEKARPDGSVGQGKFCLACQKTVVDFSKMSNEEIINFLNNTNDKVCGRIAKSQLNTPISNYRYNKTPFFNKYVAGFIMALGFYTPAHSQNTNTKPEVQQTLGEIAVKQNVASDKKLIIHGRVLDSKTKKPIANAWVNVNGGEITTSTDKNGNYTVSIPSRLQNESLVLTITYSGYEMFEVSGIDYHQTRVNVVTKLIKEEEHIKGDMMIMGKIAPSKDR
jgi:hypothetical protein